MIEFEGSTDVIIRSFKAGIGKGGRKISDEEWQAYKSSLLYTINSILASPHVRHIYVVTNAEPGSKLAELPDDDGSTPTTRLITDTFSSEKVTPVACNNWGLNPGSCAAINKVIEVISHWNNLPHWLLVLSKEMLINPFVISEMIRTSDRYHLKVCGCYRQNHWEYYQWSVAQNTVCLWEYQTLAEFSGFDTRCDGRQDETIEIESRQIQIAGMDDFHLMLRIQAKYGLDWRWGMVCNSNPLIWDLSRKSFAEMEQHLIKVRRQAKIMEIYVSEIFPELDFRTVMNLFFSRRVSV
ncbi:MAG: hypothetical protein WCV50_04330 [Patescibacteria group bacterium]